MSGHLRKLQGAASAFLLTGALAGCATYGKCGLRGCAGDANITADVQARLAQHADILPRVEVQTLNGVVYLNGAVNEGLQRTHAEAVASKTPGVAKVVDNIAIVR